MRVRINTDLDFVWRLLLEGEEVDWADYDLTVEILTPTHKKETIDFNIDGSEISFHYKPIYVGQYIISAIKNKFSSDEAAVDVKLFEGVRWSWSTDAGDDPDLVVDTISFSGDIRESVVDLKKYYTKDEIDFKFEETNASLGDVENSLSDYQEKIEDLDEIRSKANSAIQEIPSNYITEDELETRISEIDIPETDLSDYYTKTEIDEKGYITSIPSDYITETELNLKLEEVVAGDMDLTSYAKKEDLDDYYTKTEIDNKGYITSIPSDYITEDELETRISQINIPNTDLSDYYTKTEIDSKGYITSIPSDYITEDELETRISEIEIPDTDLSDYYTKSEIDSKGYITTIPSDYITENELETRISQIDIPDVDLSGKVDGEGVSKLKVITEVEYNNLTQIETNTLYILT